MVKDWKCSLIPRPCAFVTCSTKFRAKFVLQVTNAQGLGTRLLGMRVEFVYYCYGDANVYVIIMVIQK